MRIFFILHSPLPTVIIKAGETGGVTPFSLSNLLIMRSHFPHKQEMPAMGTIGSRALRSNALRVPFRLLLSHHPLDCPQYDPGGALNQYFLFTLLFGMNILLSKMGTKTLNQA